MFEYTFNMAETLATGVILLILGKYIKKKVAILNKYFIPAPVIGGFLFSLITLWGYNSQSFSFMFDSSLKDLLMIAFFTSVGYMASLKLLASGGISVIIFLAIATFLTLIQNGIGIFLAQIFNINPLLGLAAGSVSLTGGHGNAAAWGPVLEQAGAVGATTVSVAAATYGLVAGCMIGGPIGKRLLTKYNLAGNSTESFLKLGDSATIEEISEPSIFNAMCYITVAMGLGLVLNRFLNPIMTLPAYIGPMLVAALIRNIADGQNKVPPMKSIAILGNIALAIFLSLALMTMRLWELATLAIPLIVILLVQTVIMGFYAYFVTFYVMGKDYDAAVMSTGHCGFGLGATPNAMANMESLTVANGPSPKSFFVLPLVGALFIDLTNALVITFFINLF